MIQFSSGFLHRRISVREQLQGLFKYLCSTLNKWSSDDNDDDDDVDDNDDHDLHDAKHKLLSFLYENDFSLMGFEICTTYISIMLLFY